jgi:hypothetical protein
MGLAASEALGVEASNKALDSALAAIESSVEAAFAQALLDQLDEGLAAYDQWRGAVMSMARFAEKATGQHSDWGDQVSSSIERQEDQARVISTRALAALLARSLLPDHEFWILYLPFAGFIAPDSLEV